MGQKPSNMGGNFNNKTSSSLPWTLRRRERCNLNLEQPIKFQYKTKRKHFSQDGKNQNKLNNIKDNNGINKINSINNLNKTHQNHGNFVKNINVDEIRCRIIRTQNTLKATSEPDLNILRNKNRQKQRREIEQELEHGEHQFGYEIRDVDDFLSKATIEKPANIPVVLAFPSVLYQTRIGGYQAEIALPLGMVVNAVFKNQQWLYVQTPHAEEGYVTYAACLPLGIIPPPDNNIPIPCWEKSTDVFPKPSGNLTDREKLSSKSGCSGNKRCYYRRARTTVSTCEEQSVDKLYLRAAATAKKNNGIRHTLLVINGDYFGNQRNVLNVKKGEVVVLLDAYTKGWFWVKNKEGHEGFIPAAVAGHGFL